jgi:hypothetical protein
VTDETRPTESFSLPPAPVQPAGSTSPAQPGGVPGSSPFATAPTGQSPFAAPAPSPAPVVAPPARRRSGSSLLVNVLLGFALVVAVGGVAFAAGRATAPASTGTGRFGANGANGNGGFAGGFGPNASGAPNRGFGGAAGAAISIQGKVTAVAADSITIQLPSGQSVTIPTSDQTTYHNQTSASASDVTSGTDVIVQVAGGGRFVTGGNGQGNNGQGNGNGNGGPVASGAPTRGFGSASSVTIVPAGG